MAQRTQQWKSPGDKLPSRRTSRTDFSSTSPADLTARRSSVPDRSRRLPNCKTKLGKKLGMLQMLQAAFSTGQLRSCTRRSELLSAREMFRLPVHPFVGRRGLLLLILGMGCPCSWPWVSALQQPCQPHTWPSMCSQTARTASSALCSLCRREEVGLESKNGYMGIEIYACLQVN